jgi:hypothetical protein
MHGLYEQAKMMALVTCMLKQIRGVRLPGKEQDFTAWMLGFHPNCEINPGEAWHRYIR